MNVRKLAGLGLGLLAVLALAFPAFAQEITPSVTVSDQPLLNGAVTVEKVVSVGPGWIVIHAHADGKPGPILGYSPVADGENSNVMVEIDASGLGQGRQRISRLRHRLQSPGGLSGRLCPGFEETR